MALVIRGVGRGVALGFGDGVTVGVVLAVAQLATQLVPNTNTPTIHTIEPTTPLSQCLYEQLENILCNRFIVNCFASLTG